MSLQTKNNGPVKNNYCHPFFKENGNNKFNTQFKYVLNHKC